MLLREIPSQFLETDNIPKLEKLISLMIDGYPPEIEKILSVLKSKKKYCDFISFEKRKIYLILGLTLETVISDQTRLGLVSEKFTHFHLPKELNNVYAREISNHFSLGLSYRFFCSTILFLYYNLVKPQICSDEFIKAINDLLLDFFSTVQLRREEILKFSQNSQEDSNGSLQSPGQNENFLTQVQGQKVMPNTKSQNRGLNKQKAFKLFREGLEDREIANTIFGVSKETVSRWRKERILKLRDEGFESEALVLSLIKRRYGHIKYENETIARIAGVPEVKVEELREILILELIEKGFHNETIVRTAGAPEAKVEELREKLVLSLIKRRYGRMRYENETIAGMAGVPEARVEELRNQ
ncbi:MAG: hypothetical protein LBJ32_02985 [Oscillospiraceae bacterium]|nr:hypothetical protein [Oscillospiraceae bacterium]